MKTKLCMSLGERGGSSCSPQWPWGALSEGKALLSPSLPRPRPLSLSPAPHAHSLPLLHVHRTLSGDPPFEGEGPAPRGGNRLRDHGARHRPHSPREAGVPTVTLQERIILWDNTSLHPVRGRTALSPTLPKNSGTSPGPSSEDRMTPPLALPPGHPHPVGSELQKVP